jgi:signal peptidase I
LKKEKHTKEKPERKKSIFREYAESIAIAILLALLIRAFVIQAFKIPSGSMIPTLQVGDHILVNKFIYGIKLRIPFTAINQALIPISAPKRNDVVVFIYPLEQGKDFIKRVIGLPGDKIEIINKKVYINHQPMEDPHGFHTELTIIPGLEQTSEKFGPDELQKIFDNLKPDVVQNIRNNPGLASIQKIRDNLGPEVFQKIHDNLGPDIIQKIRDKFGPEVALNFLEEERSQRDRLRDNVRPFEVPPKMIFVMGDNRDSSLDSRFWGFVDQNQVLGKALIIYWSGSWNPFEVRWRRFGHPIR